MLTGALESHLEAMLDSKSQTQTGFPKERQSHRGREGLDQEEWKLVKASYPKDIGQSHTSISGQTDSMANRWVNGIDATYRGGKGT